jgi:hypothetical protein
MSDYLMRVFGLGGQVNRSRKVGLPEWRHAATDFWNNPVRMAGIGFPDDIQLW